MNRFLDTFTTVGFAVAVIFLLVLLPKATYMVFFGEEENRRDECQCLCSPTSGQYNVLIGEPQPELVIGGLGESMRSNDRVFKWANDAWVPSTWAELLRGEYGEEFKVESRFTD